jgi:hypothetical protein
MHPKQNLIPQSPPHQHSESIGTSGQYNAEVETPRVCDDLISFRSTFELIFSENYRAKMC